MIFDKPDDWFAQLAETALSDNVQILLGALIEEVNQQIIEYGPDRRDPEGYHAVMTKLFNRKELLLEQLKFFNQLKEAFEDNLRSE